MSMGTSIGKKIGNQLNMSSFESLFLVCVGRWMEQLTDFCSRALVRGERRNSRKAVESGTLVLQSERDDSVALVSRIRFGLFLR